MINAINSPVKESNLVATIQVCTYRLGERGRGLQLPNTNELGQKSFQHKKISSIFKRKKQKTNIFDFLTRF